MSASGLTGAGEAGVALPVLAIALEEEAEGGGVERAIKEWAAALSLLRMEQGISCRAVTDSFTVEATTEGRRADRLIGTD